MVHPWVCKCSCVPSIHEVRYYNASRVPRSGRRHGRSTQPMINISNKAAAELRRIVQEQDETDAAIRVFVQGACGCGAAHYGMGIETEIGEGEELLDANGIRIVIDPESAPYLDGAEIDYRDSLMGRGFMIKNPNQSGGCGCGGH